MHNLLKREVHFLLKLLAVTVEGTESLELDVLEDEELEELVEDEECLCL